MKRGILYTFVYILMTIVSVIGTIAINALLPGSDSFGTPTEFSNIESSAGEKVCPANREQAAGSCRWYQNLQ